MINPPDCPFNKLIGAVTTTSPTVTERSVTKSSPVLLYTMPMALAETLAKPDPKVISTNPVTCNAIPWSPWMTIARVALETPVPTEDPTLSDTEALFETTRSSANPDRLPMPVWKPKSPLICTKPAMVAVRPNTVTDEDPLATFRSELVETDPTATSRVVSMSAPVVL